MVDAVVVVSVVGWLDRCRDLFARAGMSKVAQVVSGGATGQESIYNGLCAAEHLVAGRRAVVLVHDGVRPLIDEDTITRNIEAVERTGSAITCVPAKETVLVKGTEGGVAAIPERASLELARAPQSFWLDELLKAHRVAIEAGRDDYVDSASLMFERGVALTPVEGPAENIKVTTPDDFFALQAILDARESRQIYEI